MIDHQPESKRLSRLARRIDGEPEDEFRSDNKEYADRRRGLGYVAAGVAVALSVTLVSGLAAMRLRSDTDKIERDLTESPVPAGETPQDDPNTVGIGPDGEPLTVDEYREVYGDE